MKKILLVLILFCIPLASALECGDIISSSVSLSEDLECPDTALTIAGSSLSLDCDDHTIKGSLSGNGIVIEGEKIEIKNCEIFNFENALLVKNVNGLSVTNSILRNNLNAVFAESSSGVSLTTNLIKDNANFGIYSVGVTDADYYDNTFENTGIEVMEVEGAEPEDAVEVEAVPVEEQDTEPAEETKEEAPIEEPSPESVPEPEPITKQITTQVTDTLLKRLGIPPWKHNQIKDAVRVHKEVTIYKDKTVYEITATTDKDLKNVNVFEYFPEDLVDSPDEIISDMQFISLQGGKLLKFEFAELKKGEDAIVQYTINKHLFKDLELTPVTIIGLEEALNPGGLLSIRILFGALLILFIINYYLKKRIHPHLKYRFVELFLILCVILFIFWNVELQIQISESWFNVGVAALLTMAMVFYVSRDLKYYKELRKEQAEGKDV